MYVSQPEALPQALTGRRWLPRCSCWTPPQSPTELTSLFSLGAELTDQLIDKFSCTSHRCTSPSALPPPSIAPDNDQTATAMPFHPPLHSHSILPLSGPLHFTYTSSLAPGVTPELWTNLPCSTWHPIPFLPLSATLWSATVDVEQQGSFEYTYRLRHPDGGIEWLGSAGRNGRIELVEPCAGVGGCPIELGAGAEVEEKGRNALLVRYELGEGVSGGVERFELGALEWEGADGVVWERSE